MDNLPVHRFKFEGKMCSRVMDFCDFAIQCKLCAINISASFISIPSQAGKSVTGRILEILAESGGKRAVVVLDTFQILSNRHEVFGMPMLARRQEDTLYIVIPSTVCKQPSPSILYI